MLTLAVGSGTGRLIAICAIPLLTRIYTPSDYGVLAVFASFVNILVPAFTLRYEIALPLPRQDGLAINILLLCSAIMCAFGIIATVALFLFSESLLPLLAADELLPFWWIIVPGAMGVATYEMLGLWATRRRAYKVIARTQLTQSLVGESLKILLGLLSIKPLGLIAGQVATQSGGIGYYLSSFVEDLRNLSRRLSVKRILFVAGYYKDFPIYRFPSQLLLVFSVQAPLLFCASSYGSNATGHLGLAIMSLGLPISLLGRSMSRAFYAEIAALGRNRLEEIRAISLSVQKRMFVIGAPAVAILFSLGPDIFRVAFGKDWYDAGLYSSYLSVFLLFQLTSAPLVQVFNIFETQRAFFLINLARLLGLIVLFFLTSLLEIGIRHFVMAYSAYMTLYYLFVSFLVFRYLSPSRA